MAQKPPVPPLGRRLRELRESRGLRPEHVAVALGLSARSISGHEAGTITPPLSTLLRYAELHGVRLSDLVADDDPAAIVARTTAEQGLTPTLQDPAALHRVAALLITAGSAA